MSKSDQKVIIDLEKCLEKSKPPVPNREGSRIRKSNRNKIERNSTRKSSVRFKVEKSDSTKNLLIDTRSEYSCSSIDLTTYVLYYIGDTTLECDTWSRVSTTFECDTFPCNVKY